MLHTLQQIFSNKIFYPVFITTTLTQLLKFLLVSKKEGKLNYKMLLSMGGMPSSHASTVASMATAVALHEKYGLSSYNFGTTLVFTLIVMYDAAGIRRSAGEQAAAINKVVDSVEGSKGKKLNHKSLPEMLGHTPYEVMAGAILGVLITLTIHNLGMV